MATIGPVTATNTEKWSLIDDPDVRAYLEQEQPAESHEADAGGQFDDLEDGLALNGIHARDSGSPPLPAIHWSPAEDAPFESLLVKPSPLKLVTLYVLTVGGAAAAALIFHERLMGLLRGW